MGQVSAHRVVARFLQRHGMEHDSPEALKDYLREHPDADKSNHTVKGDGESKEKKPKKPKKPEGDMPDFGGAAKRIWDALKSLKK